MRLRRYIYSILLTGALAGLSVACTDGPLDPDPLPVEKPASISLDCTTFYRYNGAGEVMVYVDAEDGASYDVAVPSGADWISTTTSHGTEDGFVSFTLKPNTTSKNRAAAIRFQYGPNLSRTLNITQDAGAIEDHYAEWGIEGKLQAHVSNDRPYNWYIDQGETGIYSKINCGPSSAAMAVRWYDRDSREKAEDARALYKSGGGEWYTIQDLVPYLRDKHIPYNIIQLAKADDLKDYLDKGSIAIACLDMSILSYDSDAKHRVNKFYDYVNGHYLVIMGYVQTDKALYYQAFDPFTMMKYYSDLTWKGKGRYYSASEMMRSISEWNNRTVYVLDVK